MPSRPISPADSASLEARIGAQRFALAQLEQALWEDGLNAALVAPYQAAFRDLERLIAARGADRRHRFVIVIPVADSPRHLKSCFDSLLELCRAFGYGGMRSGRYWKVSVLLADDSGDPGNIARNKALVRALGQAGVTAHYFGQSEQVALMGRLAALDLSAITGDAGPGAFSHKGQAMMRNIAYLKLAEMHAQAQDERLLFYTVDSDQEFRVKVATDRGDRNVCAVNFFYQLDEIFTRSDAQVLTGKVVGDPPVSPAVMAGNFLQDVTGFLREMAASDPQQAYRPRGADTRGSGEAAYHDMADLFGFPQPEDAYRFPCTVPGEPSNGACFRDFSGRLNRFFHGEHPTRITYYRHQEALRGLQPARTVYTGNYCFRAQALEWFIPFAPLRLRMSGPVMGRLIRAQIGDRFVSANLPMLHRRTLERTGQSEFRPGVRSENQVIDLCGEVERQFYGDVMLFAVERLTDMGFPARPLPETVIEETLDAVHAQMRTRYATKRDAIRRGLGLLESLLHDPAHWWNRCADHAGALEGFRAFARNMAHNFGEASPCYARIERPGNWQGWRARQRRALLSLPENRQAWAQALERLRAVPGRDV